MSEPLAAQGSALVAAQAVAARLAQRAEQVDGEGVTRADLQPLADAGLLGIAGRVDEREQRAVQAVLAGADASTWFVSVQHHYLVRQLAALPDPRPDQTELLEDLRAGRRLAGVAFSHVRRWPARPVQVTRVDGGWRYDGLVPWYTGWGLNEVLTLGGVTGSDAEGGADDEVVFAVVPAVASEHLLPEPMRLAAMSGTRTMTLRLDGLVVGDEQVVHRSPVRVWRERDRRGAVATNPAVLGVAAAALDRLEQGARRVGSREGLAAVAALRSRLDDVSARIDALIDRSAEVADEADAVAAEQVHLRTLAHRVALDVTAALVGAGGGRAMSLTDPAQRWAREALFLVVQAQTAPARADFLSSFG